MNTTRSLVPRVDGEGSLGVKNKRWGNIQAVKLNDVLVPTEPDIEDAYKVLRLNGDATEFEYVSSFLPDIAEEDAGKILTAIGYNTVSWTDYPTINSASADIAGIVQIGSGLSIDEEGLLTADVQDVSIATYEKAGIVKVGNDLIIENSILSTNATNLNTADTIVKRDTNGNFCAGTITCNINGNSTTSALSTTTNAIAQVDVYTGETDPSGVTRINIDGYLYATRVYNAVYNDYAECFLSNNLDYNKIKHRIIEIDNESNIQLASNESDGIVGIVSDNYSMLIGGSEKEVEDGFKIPIGLMGTLWVDSEEKVSKESIKLFICSGIDGKAKVISRGNAYKYEGCIVGKIIDINEKENRYKILLALH